jgi:hypothetical protein
MDSGGSDGPGIFASVPSCESGFIRILRHLPSGLICLPANEPLSASIKQLTLPLRTSQGRAKRRYQTPPPQSQPALSAEQRAQELARVAAGESYRKIARDSGVTYGAIYCLARAARATHSAPAQPAHHDHGSLSHMTGEEGTR